MKKNNLLTVFLLAILVVAFPFSQVKQAEAQLPKLEVVQVFWGDSSEGRLQAKPGNENVPLTVVVENVNQATMESVVAELSLSGSPFTNPLGGAKAWAGYAQSLPPGGTASLVFRLNISPDAETGTYNLALKVQTKTPRFASGVDVSLRVPVPLRGEVVLSLASTPETIQPGGDVLTLTVANVGDAAASEVEVTAAFPSPLALMAEDGFWSFPEIGPSQNVSIPMRVFAPSSMGGQAAQISLSISYRDAYGFPRTETKTVGLTVKGHVAAAELRVLQAGWGLPADPQGVGPGDRNRQLYVLLQNLSNQTVVGVRATLHLTEPFTNTTGGDTATAFISLLEPTQTGLLNFSLDISSEAELGVYPLRVKVDYYVRNDLASPVEYIEAPPLELPLQVSLFGNSVLTVVVEGNEIVAGRKSPLSFTVRNVGTADVWDLDVTLTMPKAGGAAVAGQASQAQSSLLVLLEGDGFWHFDSVKAGSWVTFTAFLSTAKDTVGTYQVELTLDYEDSWGNTVQETRTVGLTVTSHVPSSLVSVKAYQTVPKPVVQGEVFTLSLELVNSGEAQAQLVVAQLTAPRLFAALTPSTVSIGDMAPGEIRKVDYEVMTAPEVEAGVVHAFQIKLSYRDSLGREQSTVSSLGVPVHGIVELVTYDVSTSPSPVPLGGEFTVTLTLLNRGTVTAQYTEVSLVSQPPFITTGGSASYLGDVDPNAPLPISLTAVMDPHAEVGTHWLKIQVAYKDEFRVDRFLTVEVPVEVAGVWTPPESETLAPVYLLPLESWKAVGAFAAVAATAIAASVILARKVRRRRSVEQS